MNDQNLIRFAKGPLSESSPKSSVLQLLVLADLLRPLELRNVSPSLHIGSSLQRVRLLGEGTGVEDSEWGLE